MVITNLIQNNKQRHASKKLKMQYLQNQCLDQLQHNEYKDNLHPLSFFYLNNTLTSVVSH
jgi:hypothetical protein